MPDYHTKPVLQARVHAESLAWARSEAERRGQSFGDFIDGLIATERDRTARPAAEWAMMDGWKKPMCPGTRSPTGT